MEKGKEKERRGEGVVMKGKTGKGDYKDGQKEGRIKEGKE